MIGSFVEKNCGILAICPSEVFERVVFPSRLLLATSKAIRRHALNKYHPPKRPS